MREEAGSDVLALGLEVGVGADRPAPGLVVAYAPEDRGTVESRHAHSQSTEPAEVTRAAGAGPTAGRARRSGASSCRRPCRRDFGYHREIVLRRQGSAHVDLGVQGSVHGAPVRDLEKSPALFGVQGATQGLERPRHRSPDRVARRVRAARLRTPVGGADGVAVGDTFNFVALALLVYDLTGSGLGVSGVVVAEIVPVLLLAPLAGPLVDRWPRVRVMIGSDVSRLVLAVLLAVWHDAPVGVYAVAFAMSFTGVFFNPAASSVLPALVPKEALVAANTGIWTAAVLSQIVMAPLAGLLVVSLGYGPAFSINAASYAVRRCS